MKVKLFIALLLIIISQSARATTYYFTNNTDHSIKVGFYPVIQGAVEYIEGHYQIKPKKTITIDLGFNQQEGFLSGTISFIQEIFPNDAIISWWFDPSNPVTYGLLHTDKTTDSEVFINYSGKGKAIITNDNVNFKIQGTFNTNINPTLEEEPLST